MAASELPVVVDIGRNHRGPLHRDSCANDGAVMAFARAIESGRRSGNPGEARRDRQI